MSEFLEALAEYLEAKAERDKAVGNCDGSWGYHCHYEIERVEKCVEQCKSAFEKLFQIKTEEVANG